MSANGMFSFYVDPKVRDPQTFFHAEGVRSVGVAETLIPTATA